MGKLHDIDPSVNQCCSSGGDDRPWSLSGVKAGENFSRSRYLDGIAAKFPGYQAFDMADV